MGIMKQNGRLTKETALPLSCFGEELKKHLSYKIFDESVATLEDMTRLLQFWRENPRLPCAMGYSCLSLHP